MNFEFKIASLGNVVFIDRRIMDVAFLISLTHKKSFLFPHYCIHKLPLKPNRRIKFYLKRNNTFMLQSTHKMANLNQNEICAVLCSKRQYKQHGGEKGQCEILHVAGLLNSENQASCSY